MRGRTRREGYGIPRPFPIVDYTGRYGQYGRGSSGGVRRTDGLAVQTWIEKHGANVADFNLFIPCSRRAHGHRGADIPTDD